MPKSFCSVLRCIALSSAAFLLAQPAYAAGGAFPPFNTATFSGQIFWLFVTFGALYLLMSRIALPRVGEIIEERKGVIETALKAAHQAQKGAEEAAIAHEQSLAAAKANAQAIALEARAKSGKEIETARQAVEKDLSTKMIAAEARITETRARAMDNVGGIAEEAVGAIIEQLTGKAPASAAIVQALATARGA